MSPCPNLHPQITQKENQETAAVGRSRKQLAELELRNENLICCAPAPASCRSCLCNLRNLWMGFLSNPFTLNLTAHSSCDGFDLNRFICERLAFSLRVRFFILCGTRVGTRLAGR